MQVMCEDVCHWFSTWLLLKLPGKLKNTDNWISPQRFGFNWIGMWPEREDYLKLSGGSSVQPMMRTADLGQIFHSKLTCMS